MDNLKLNPVGPIIKINARGHADLYISGGEFVNPNPCDSGTRREGDYLCCWIQVGKRVARMFEFGVEARWVRRIDRVVPLVPVEVRVAGAEPLRVGL